MWNLVRAPLRALAAALVLAFAGAGSGAMAGQFSVGVIEYNTKAGGGGWTTRFGNVLEKQIGLIVEQIGDKSNPSPVQFIALAQSGVHSATCTAHDDTLMSCALEHHKLPGWKTIISDCDLDQTQLAYSKDWQLVAAAGTTNPLVDGYHANDPTIQSVCWDHGRAYNIAYFENVASKETVLFVVVHMPHQYPDCSANCPYAGRYYWDIPQFKQNVATVVGAKTDLTKVHLIVAGDMNELGRDADPAKFASMLGDFGTVTISAQSVNPPIATCCANDNYTAGDYDRIVTNSSVTPQSLVIKPKVYPLNKTKTDEEHRAIYGVVTFP